MKKQHFTFLLSLIILLPLTSCNNDSSSRGNFSKTDAYSLNYVGSRMFVQPLDKTIALAFASVRAKVFFEFIDSIYCNVSVSSAAGDVILSRKYKIDTANVLTLDDPLTGRKIHFKMVVVNDSTINLKSDGNKGNYRMLSGSNITNTLNSDNELKKNELMYPTLDEKEREFGAEDRVVKTDDGKITMVSNSMKEQARKINIFDLF